MLWNALMAAAFAPAAAAVLPVVARTLGRFIEFVALDVIGGL